MRKKLAALLCAIMSISVFTGCSSTELSYLQMATDMMNIIEVYESSGSVNVDVDMDAMKNFTTKVSKAAGATDEEIQGVLSGAEDLSGKRSIAVDYTLKMDMDTLEYYLDLDVTYEGNKYDMGDMYFSMTEGVFVSNKAVLATYEIMADITGNKDSYLLNESFQKELNAALNANEYILLLSAEEMGSFDDGSMQTMPEGGYSDLYASALKFYEDAFSGFTTGMVSEVSGGYKVQLDGQEAAQLVIDLIDYVGNNPETVLSATTTYMLEVMDKMNIPEEEKATFKAEMDAAVVDVAEFKSATDLLVQEIETAIAKPAVSSVLDSLAYETTVTRAGTTFNTEELFTITDGGKSVLKIVTDSKTKPSLSKISVPTSGVSMEKVNDDLTTLTKKYNPVTSVTLLWGWEGDSEAMMSKERADVSIISDDTGFTDYVIKEGRAYLPLRDICEALGETVEWNNAERTAYVVREDGKTAMKGILQDGTAFVSVRDFEKLGYTVSYEAVDGLKEVVIAK